MNSNDSTIIILSLLIVFAVIGALIALAVHLIRKSKQSAQDAESAYGQLMQSLPSDKQMVFAMQFNSVKKNPSTAVLLALFLGGLGVHKFYVGQTGLGILYLLFCWTYIPAILGVIEAFTITGNVAGYNQQRATEIAGYLR